MPATQTRENLRKKRTGIVLSNRMKKTIVVQIKRKTRHSLYGKIIEKASKFKVHDEKNSAQIGDEVSIEETRPVSKDKRWRLVKILSHGHGKATDDLKEAPGITAETGTAHTKGIAS
ncbi:MAG: 30S ribosomal protein S17 [Candidatus Omnitrophica bacterium CG07_land_8_20_14_0_80_50_8]|nr:MAG: 30S ribosomal protein S17 [Candidatus Omnitrophica bacterium CG1_02_49_16]PIU40267.1 MAG: 30S ribosomal protein S17 [Candidatus Omnitrophica bacterium CG07_land_8_20_14_0_80_50_8]